MRKVACFVGDELCMLLIKNRMLVTTKEEGYEKRDMTRGLGRTRAQKEQEAERWRE